MRFTLLIAVFCFLLPKLLLLAAEADLRAQFNDRLKDYEELIVQKQQLQLVLGQDGEISASERSDWEATIKIQAYEAAGELAAEYSYLKTQKERREFLTDMNALLHSLVQELNAIRENINRQLLINSCPGEAIVDTTTPSSTGIKQACKNPRKNYLVKQLENVHSDYRRLDGDLYKKLSSTLPIECVTEVGARFRIGALSPLRKNDKYVTCKDAKSRPVRGNIPACWDDNYQAIAYNSYVDMASCVGIDPKEFFPVVAQESQFQTNLLSKSWAAGFCQLTESAMAHVKQDRFFNDWTKKIDKRANGLKIPEGKDKGAMQASCKRVQKHDLWMKLNQFKDARCSVLYPPKNPMRSTLYCMTYYDYLRKMLRDRLLNSKSKVYSPIYDLIRKKFKKPIDPKVLEKLSIRLAQLAVNMGPTAIRRYLVGYLQTLGDDSGTLAHFDMKQRFGSAKGKTQLVKFSKYSFLNYIKNRKTPIVFGQPRKEKDNFNWKYNPENEGRRLEMSTYMPKALLKSRSTQEYVNKDKGACYQAEVYKN